MDLAIVELREYLEHERNARYALTDSLRDHRKNRETERAKNLVDYEVTQLQDEHDVRSIVAELG
uniref:Uncharacterized protein n=1 Tax=Peronospora matthiolae TaxID=2874970 RepID=A0AAV1V260_9STRA